MRETENGARQPKLGFGIKNKKTKKKFKPRGAVCRHNDKQKCLLEVIDKKQKNKNIGDIFMKKTMKRAIALSLAMASIVSVSACGGTTIGGDVDKDGFARINVTYYSAGYGEEYMNDIIAKFNDRASNGEYEFKVTGVPDNNISANMNSLMQQAQNSSSIVLPDLILVSEYNSNMAGKKGFLEELTSVYDTEVVSKASATGKMKIRDKFSNSDIVNRFSDENGKLYGLPMYGATIGIVYNKALFDEYQLKEPTTMKEYWELMDDIYNLERNVDASVNNDISAFIYPNMAIQYFDYYVKASWMQLLGFDDFSSLVNLDGLETKVNEYEQYYKAVYQNLQTFATSAPGYDAYMPQNEVTVENLKRNVTTISKHTDVWPAMGKQVALMTIAGDWARNESGAALKDEELGFFPFPLVCDVNTGKVIAKATPKSEVDNEAAYVKVKREDVDSSVIPASDVNEEYIYFKQVNYSNIGKVDAVVPKAGKYPEYAKEFLAYLISDEAIDIYMKKAGSWLPYQYTLTEEEMTAAGLCEFTKECLMIGQYADSSINRYKSKAVLYNLLSFEGKASNYYTNLFKYNVSPESLYNQVKEGVTSGLATLEEDIRLYEVAQGFLGGQ